MSEFVEGSASLPPSKRKSTDIAVALLTQPGGLEHHGLVNSDEAPAGADPMAEATEGKRLLKIDLGCGTHKVGPDWIGVDSRGFPGVDLVLDLCAGGDDVTRMARPSIALLAKFERWPWADNSVDEAYSSHFVEHLTRLERVHFANELWRVLKPGAECKILVPHWCSERAYGDLTHEWPAVCEMWFLYLHRTWREQNAAHNDGYKCNFDTIVCHLPEPSLIGKDSETQMFALKNYKAAAQDIVAILTKREFVGVWEFY